MRSHAKASTAGSTQRQAKGLGRSFRGAFATRGASLSTKGSGAPKTGLLALALCTGLLASLAFGAVSATASVVHNFKEVLGSAEVAAIAEGRNVAIDQSNGDVLVMDENGPRIRRFKPDGTPDNFSALGSNVIDGKEGADATPQGKLSFAPSSESQIAVDNSGGATDGDIYVTHGSPNLIDIFSKTGAYLGQLTESSGGSFSEACGVAVDSSGAVYVGDYSGGIHKFVPSANPPVNADNTANFNSVSQPCTLAAGAGPTAGFLFPATYNGSVYKIDSATGELKYTVASGSHTTVGVDPANGHVFAAADSTLEEFDASGAGSATELSATKNTESIRGIAVRASSGEIYLTGQISVFVYDAPIATVPDTLTTAATANTGTHATLNGTVNPNGIELSECFFEWTKSFNTPTSYEHTVPCVESPATIGAGTSPVSVHADLSYLQPNATGYHFRLVAKNAQGPSQGPNDIGFTTSYTVITTTATTVTDTDATLNGTVNPDSVAMTECLFEWGTSTSYGNTAPCVPNAAGIGSGTSPVAVAANINGLHAGTVYHFRLKAANANGPILGGDETLQSAGPAIVDTWAEDVVITEAFLKAEINPEGAATTYHFEYGTSEAYGSETPELAAGSDSSNHEVTRFLEGLQQGTTYHYRVVATSAAGTNEGPDRTIRTFAPATTETDCPNQAFRFGAGASLPDCRAYEMVSPLDKNNGDIRVLRNFEVGYPASVTESTPSGGKITYSSFRAFGDAQSTPYTSQYIAQRQAGEGWETHSINEPRSMPINEGLGQFFEEYRAFSEDLCQGWMTNFSEPPLGAGALAGYSNLYRRNDRLCGPESFEAVAPIVTPAMPGNEFLANFQGASADGSHAIFVSNSKLAPEGTEATEQLYESAEPGAPPQFVCVLPGGEAWKGPCAAGGRGVSRRGADILGAISADGERIFWTTEPGEFSEGKLYVRVGGTETLAVSQAAETAAGTTGSFFWGAATDGSRAIFTTGDSSESRLFAFDLEGEVTEPIAEGVLGVMGMSKDARRVYFVSSKALAGAAVAGKPNLYLYDADQGSGTTTFIATLAASDASGQHGPIARSPRERTSRVTPDGLHAAFTSEAPLTGYDNKALTGGFVNLQAYVYDANSEELLCASCNPSGARGQREIDSEGITLGVIPGFETSLNASRLLSEDGSRLFFQSANSLTPRDSNGKVDVYEWEAEGAGSCDAGDSSFAPSADGCISLITSGNSDVDSEFVEASTTGDDVFVNTLSSLVPQDYGLKDIYDARALGGFPLPPEAPECIGDACQSIPAAPNDPTPASAGFRGAGNPQPRKAHKRRCRARASHAGKRAKRKAPKSCKRAKRRTGR